jgi:hypothetical protein
MKLEENWKGICPSLLFSMKSDSRLLSYPLQRVLEKGKLTIQHSALDQRSQATVRVENQLGRDMWLRVIDASRGESAERILHLPAGQETRVALPPPQTLRRTTSGRSAALLPSDRNGTEQLRPKARRFAAVRIGKAEVRVFSSCSILFVVLDTQALRMGITTKESSRPLPDHSQAR